MEVTDEGIDIGTTPVASVHALTIACVGGIVGDGHASLGVGVEVVIDVQSVHVVAAEDVACHMADVGTVLRDAGVEDHQTAVLETAFGVTHGIVLGGQGRGTCRLGTVGVDPGMDLHATLVALFHHPGQGIPVGVRGKSLLPGEVAAPGLQAALIEGIALGTYLEEDGIDA